MCALLVLVVGYKRLGAELNGELVAPICWYLAKTGVVHYVPKIVTLLTICSEKYYFSLSNYFLDTTHVGDPDY